MAIKWLDVFCVKGKYYYFSKNKLLNLPLVNRWLRNRSVTRSLVSCDKCQLTFFIKIINTIGVLQSYEWYFVAGFTSSTIFVTKDIVKCVSRSLGSIINLRVPLFHNKNSFLSLLVQHRHFQCSLGQLWSPVNHLASQVVIWCFRC